MKRDERERLADRIAFGLAGPEETQEILARAATDERLARLIKADAAITAGLSMDKGMIPAGAVQPGAHVLSALDASSKAVGGSMGTSFAVKGILGGLGAIGLVVGYSLITSPPTEQPPTPQESVQSVKSVPTLAPPTLAPVDTGNHVSVGTTDHETTAVRQSPRTNARSLDARSTSSSNAKARASRGSQPGESASDNPWSKKSKPKTVTNTATDAPVKTH